MKASVIVIAYNEEKYIKKCIDSILTQSFKDYELIVVDDGSIDRTAEIVKSYRNKLHYVKIRHSGYSTARNAGIKRAKGELVFFTDADCIVDKQWLEVGTKHMDSNPKVIAAGGQVKKPPIPDQKVWITDCSVYKHYKHPSTMNCVYRYDFLKKMKGFKKRYNVGGEDRDLGLRAQKVGQTGTCDMLVTHRRKRIDLNRGLSLVRRHIHVVYLIKDHGKEFSKLRKSELCFGFILNPRYFASIIFPPYLFYWHLKGKKHIFLRDILNVIPLFFGMILIRIFYWRTAFRERIFLI